MNMQSHGLSNDSVRCMLMDSRGYLWIGTSRGVVVYDYGRDVFVKPLDQGGNVPEGVVNHLHADNEGNVWMDITDCGIYSCRIADGVLVYRYPYQGRWTVAAEKVDTGR